MKGPSYSNGERGGGDWGVKDQQRCRAKMRKGGGGGGTVSEEGACKKGGEGGKTGGGRHGRKKRGGKVRNRVWGRGLGKELLET